MKKVLLICSLAVLTLSLTYCTPEILSLIPQTGKGKFETELTGAPVPYPDCSGNILNLVSGHMSTDFNVVANANVVNGYVHVVINNLVFATADSSLVYRGKFNSTLSASANNGQALVFDAKFKMEAEGKKIEKEMEARVKFKAIVNQDGTLTLTDSKISTECEN